MQFKRLYQKNRIWVFVIIVLAFTSCGDELQQGLRAVPAAYGEINKILVVTDQAMWDGALGDTLQDYYASRYPVLPQPEPMFDLEYLSPQQYTADRIRREASDYLILADLSDTYSPTSMLVNTVIGEEHVRRAKADPTYHTVIAQDKYAEGQLIIYQFAFSEAALLKNIAQNFPALAKKFREADARQIENILYKSGENQEVAKELARKLGVQMRVPKDYFLASRKDQVFWLRKETGKLSSNILLKKIPYVGAQQLTRDSIRAIRDSISKKYISSQLPGTYMRINDADLPMFVDRKTIHQRPVLEARGIWEMKNDYMTGAFISYLIHNEQKNELLFVDGFVYAPGEEKRNWLQYLEYIIHTIQL